jgi:hypothetical protein
MDRLARHLEDLRRLARDLTGRGVTVRFIKEGLTFTGDDSPMATLLLSVMGAFAEFERSLIRERQAEGIALAKQRGVYKGRPRSLPPDVVATLRQRVAAGEPKVRIAQDLGISRSTLYDYLRDEGSSGGDDGSGGPFGRISPRIADDAGAQQGGGRERARLQRPDDLQSRDGPPPDVHPASRSVQGASQSCGRKD